MNQGPVSRSIIGLQQRAHEIGRIRIGKKIAITKRNGEPGSRPTKLSTFRLTSKDKTMLEAAASIYGGKVEPFDGKPGEWDLVTGADVMNIMLPAGSVVSQSMEFWSGALCQRRCNGEIEEISNKPCLCAAEEAAAVAKGESYECPCKPTTRLNVHLVDIPGIGVWRLETHGWNAAKELLTPVQLLHAMQTGGRPIKAQLAMEERSRFRRKPKNPSETETVKFLVPVIRVPKMLSAMMSELGAPQKLALPGSGMSAQESRVKSADWLGRIGMDVGQIEKIFDLTDAMSIELPHGLFKALRDQGINTVETVQEHVTTMYEAFIRSQQSEYVDAEYIEDDGDGSLGL